MKRFEVHSHTESSNIRLLDSINKVEKLIDKAISIGLKGIAITDHEFLGNIPKAFRYYESIKKDNPDFKVGFGNEIYLVEDRHNVQKYYHFILIAKNKKGWRALRELSSRAWLQSYVSKGQTRVPTTYKELEEIVNKYPDSLIATTACIGGELSQLVLQLDAAEQAESLDLINEYKTSIHLFITKMKKWFGDDFYIEVAPSRYKEQILVNKRLLSIAKAYGIKNVIGSDAHYLNKEDRFVHSSYLNSKGGERETDAFYMYTYLQDDDDIHTNLNPSFDEETIDEMYENSIEIYSKIDMYSIWHKQTIPSVDIKNYPKKKGDCGNYKTLNKMFESDDVYNRYWINQCIDKLKELDKFNDTYLSRLEEEAVTKEIISNELETNIFKYPITMQAYIDIIWESGSTIGAGRGSSCAGLNHYLLGVTQLDPIEWNLPWFRYLNEKRVELPDIDIDICPSKRPIILNKIKQMRGQKFTDNTLTDVEKNELGCTLIATFGTETIKSAIQTACRGYRDDLISDGIDNTIAEYLSSLVPNERDFTWTMKDMYYGNPEKGKKPVTTFVNEIKKYDGGDNYASLAEIIFAIEGMIKQRGSHASGVIMNDEDPYEFLAYMRSPKGDVTTQFDLHDCEAMGATKYDFLVTEVQDKLVTTIDLLKKDKVLPNDMTLKDIYNTYFHPNVIPYDNKETWEKIKNNELLDMFQFDSQQGRIAIKKIQPSNIQELTDANGLLRLMPMEKGGEAPIDKYVRFKNNIELWYREMKMHGITKEQTKVLERYFLKSYGVPPSQEQLMLMLMDKDICNFSIEEANKARKIVAKKIEKDVEKLKQKIFERATDENMANYVWKFGVGPQMSYAFNVIHAIAYSIIGYQTAYIATKFNPIYWNTACIIVNSGGLEDKSADYGKIAKALCTSLKNGINVSLLDVNKSSLTFKPNIETNTIMYGFKALSGLNNETIHQIIENRPYVGIKDFMNKNSNLNKRQMLSLIKSGGFDFDTQLDNDRKKIMVYYLISQAKLKTTLNMRNYQFLIKNKLLPKTQEFDFCERLFYINKDLKKNNMVFNDYLLNFYNEFFDYEYLDFDEDGKAFINDKVWKKLYDTEMLYVKEYIKENLDELLDKVNFILLKELWDKYGKGSLSHWEMDSMCFYYHDHELKYVNKEKYGIVDYDSLSEEPEVDKSYTRGNITYNTYNLHSIIGTVIGKNDTKSIVTLLTVNGDVVSVKFTREYYARYNKQISELNMDGTKSIVEKSWFTRGSLIMVTGFRRGDQFISKTYKKTLVHQLYKILNVDENGNITLKHNRYGEISNEE